MNIKDILNLFWPDYAYGKKPVNWSKFRAANKYYRFSDYLPYLAMDVDGFLVNEDGYGFILECIPQSGSDQGMIRILESIFMQEWPEHTCIQFCMYASPNVSNLLEQWKNRRMPGIYRDLASKRVDFLKQATHKSLWLSSPFLVRHFRLIISVVCNGEPTLPRMERLGDLRGGLQSTLNSAHIPSKPMLSNSLVTLIAEMLNNKEYIDEHPVDSGKPLKYQMMDYDKSIVVAHDRLDFDDMEIRCMSVKSYPDEFVFPGMSALMGDMFQNALQLNCPFMLSAGIYLPNPESTKAKTQMRAARATQQAESPMAKFLPDLKMKKNDFDIVMAAMADGGTVVKMHHQLVLFAQKGEGDTAEQAAKAVYRSKNWELSSDKYIQVHALLSSLPGALSYNMWRDLEGLERPTTKTTANVIHLSPILADWRGTGTPTLQLLSRRGQLMYIDIFDNTQGNYNVAIAAASGSGKSFLLNEIVTSTLGTGGRAWIIDVGRSYEKLCSLLGGTFIVFDPTKPICLNPFTNIRNIKEELSMLKPLLGQMACMLRTLDDLESAWMEEAIMDAWNKKKNDATVTMVADYLLQQPDQRCKDLGTMLMPYTARGMYSHFFEGKANLKFNNELIVLELEELKSKKDLQSVVLLIVMYQIQQAMYLGNRSQRKICVIDEAWDLMSGGGTAEFIERGYRVARKYGGAFITATQGVDDYFKNEGSKAAFNSSDWMLLLRNKPESIESLDRSGRISMGEHMKSTLMSMQTQFGMYADVMIFSPMGSAIGRLIVDPFSELLYSSKAEQFEAVRNHVAQGKSMMEAIEACLKNK
ncbi:MAG: type IV secretion system protein TraC [Mariprofundales bacterium]